MVRAPHHRLSAALAGVLIAVIGAADTLYADAATYLVSFALVALFVNPPEVLMPEDENRSVLAGARFVFSDRLLRIWTPALTALDVCWTLFFATLPVLVVTQYDANPRVLGLLFGTRSVLAVVLGVQSVAVLSIVAGALAERASLRAGPIDSPA